MGTYLLDICLPGFRRSILPMLPTLGLHAGGLDPQQVWRMNHFLLSPSSGCGSSVGVSVSYYVSYSLILPEDACSLKPDLPWCFAARTMVIL